MNKEPLDNTIDIEKVLDVTQIEPRLKHPTIFKYFDNLGPGDYFIIHNDHDPKPLYYQLLGERGNIFSFEYLSKGPEDWFIQIQKNQAAPKKTAAEDDQPIEKEKKNATHNAVKQNADSSNKKTAEEKANPEKSNYSNKDILNDGIILQYDRWPVGFLAAFIEQTDHVFFREETPALDELGAIIEQKHKQKHPELVSLKMYQDQLFATLLFHLTQEHAALFDSIKTVEQLKTQDQDTAEQESDLLLLLSSLHTSATIKKQANQTLLQLLESIRKHSNNYQAPSDACDSYIYYYKRLHQFDLRLSRYLHLETTVLLPKIDKWF